MSIEKLAFTKDWTSEADFPTYESDATQVRKDMQCLHDETKDYINNKLIPQTEEALAAKANNDNVILKDATEVFTPTADAHPVSKKYVDDVARDLALGAIADKTITEEKLSDDVLARSYTKEETLTGDTAARFGLVETAVPNDVLGKIKDLFDAGVKLATGSYVGTGTYGEDNPCTLTFDFQPKLVMVYAAECMNDITVTSDIPWREYKFAITAPYGASAAQRYTIVGENPDTFANAVAVVTDYFIWEGTTFSWYTPLGGRFGYDRAGMGQLNEEGVTYYYLAIGEGSETV